ncbi:putative sulfatase [Flavihumibacter petaseus NBRC 106054]|uniref:Putative sulfatase n=2 Tax=Flavihumibacter TaxID=1004301 RepID=A0A0E9N3P8_9BACT|nr:putative sulfatase [Flavihumibacter petaseus NBRC 106054]
MTATAQAVKNKTPNVILIMADDLGYGDLSCYGATKLRTPYLDQLAAGGIRFTNAHSTSSTCTPSRYALMTGQYPWRRSGTGILPGDAALIVPTDRITLPKVFKNAGYHTGIVGKWHLGLGTQVEKNWNGTISPGPNETGFDYSFIFPATADRVPTVFVENHRVIGLDTTDPILVDYAKKVGDEPTGLEHPELLKMQATPGHGHNQTIVNGIGRIGYMKGGKMARWTDEEMPLTFLEESRRFIRDHRSKPFFLVYNLTEPHVPRVPSTMFKGKSGLGYRGDAILQLDWSVGQILHALDAAGIRENTIIVFTSDNGPVLDDGYMDGAVSQLNGHTPWGALRGGKYSVLEAGTRVPFIVTWPAGAKKGVSDALICQVDLLASFSALLRQRVPAGEAADSESLLPALLGESSKGRNELVEQGSTYGFLQGDWKYIVPNNGPANTDPERTNIETGNSPLPQLYHLKKDPCEKDNLASQYPGKVKEMAEALEKIKNRQQGK